MIFKIIDAKWKIFERNECAIFGFGAWTLSSNRMSAMLLPGGGWNVDIKVTQRAPVSTLAHTAAIQHHWLFANRPTHYKVWFIYAIACDERNICKNCFKSKSINLVAHNWMQWPLLQSLENSNLNALILIEKFNAQNICS